MQSAQQYHQQSDSWWIDIFFLTLVIGSLFFILLGNRPLFVPDEGRYADIAREMVASGDYITPYLNGIKYFEKPILFYWLSAAAIKVAGLNIWALRCVNALIGLIGCLLTYFTGRKLYGRNTGLLAALILGTSTLYFVMAHMISLDLPVTVLLAGSLYAFLLGSREMPGLPRRLYFWGAATAAAFAVLTKGLIGIVFPALIIGTWITIMGEWRLLKRMYLPSCMLIFLLIAAPWHLLVGHRNPEFFYFYFIEQHFLRYATMDVGHYQPIWFFIPHLLIGFFPWIVFLPQTIATLLQKSFKQRGEYKTEIFFLLWAVLIFTFFSFSKSKLIPYILPVFPPLAMLTAHYLQAGYAKQRTHCTAACLGIKTGYLFLILLAATIAGAFYWFINHTSLPDPNAARTYIYLAAFILVMGSVIACFYAFRNLSKALALTIVSTWLFLLLILASLPYVDTRTILPLATIIKPVLQPQDVVVTYNQYYQDLPFYLERRISILNWRNELTFGMRHQDTHEWMIDDTAFWRDWHSDKRVFAIASKEEYLHLQQKYPQETFYLLGRTINNVLISNRKPENK